MGGFLELLEVSDCVMSSGGGTGKATGFDVLDSLLISSTLIGPELLFKLIWYFFCPFWP